MLSFQSVVGLFCSGSSGRASPPLPFHGVSLRRLDLQPWEVFQICWEPRSFCALGARGMKAFACVAGSALPLSASRLKVAGVKIRCLSCWVAAFRNQSISCVFQMYQGIKEPRALLSREDALGGLFRVQAPSKSVGCVFTLSATSQYPAWQRNSFWSLCFQCRWVNLEPSYF